MTLTPADAWAVRMHAERSYPLEACGVIFARGVERVVLTCSNVHREPRVAFTIAAEDTVRIADHLARGFTMLAVYHSHVDQHAYLSGGDHKYAPPGVAQVVVPVYRGVAREPEVFV